MNLTANDLIVRHYGPLASRRKILALHAKAKIRTAENWLLGLCCPQFDNLREICNNNPEFKADLIALLEGKT